MLILVLMKNPLTMSTIVDILVLVLMLIEFGHIFAEKLSWNAPFVCINPSFISRGDAEVLAWLRGLA